MKAAHVASLKEEQQEQARKKENETEKNKFQKGQEDLEKELWC